MKKSLIIGLVSALVTGAGVIISGIADCTARKEAYGKEENVNSPEIIVDITEPEKETETEPGE